MDMDITKAALALRGVYMTEQWGGAHVFKVGTASSFKMFAILRPGANRLTVKASDADVRQLLIEVGVAEAHSHLPHGNWVVLLLDKLEREDVIERLVLSYDIIFPSLPKVVREGLGS